MQFRVLTVSLASALIALSACSGGSESPADQTVESIPEALASTDSMSQTARALELTGLDGIFAGEASYTLLAPTNSAFARVEGSQQLFEEEEALPALAALLRQHMLPGYVTPDDLAAAIAASPDGKVVMLTMDGSEVTFSTSSGQLQVAGPDGAIANLSGEPVASQASIAIPVDAILITP
jgi:uncharacterized surface protein with fasciclin (FAS1) repeats